MVTVRGSLLLCMPMALTGMQPLQYLLFTNVWLVQNLALVVKWMCCYLLSVLGSKPQSQPILLDWLSL